MKRSIVFILLILNLSITYGQKPRARELGVPFNGTTGQFNAMIAAETMEGINGNKSYALPHDLLVEVLKKYNRLNK
ncbi:hypothetical protein [Aquiflexum lacus]|uniref:hypothetical protein n=1 Tax=Aquiflexum lacus TaxID=2483805 RepID=UPI0018938967|nr:hypothetical protein [Aquiflexum lacus]